jgi:hypothetical protein
MSRVEFEPTIPMFEQVKTDNALDRVAHCDRLQRTTRSYIPPLWEPQMIHRSQMSYVKEVMYAFIVVYNDSFDSCPEYSAHDSFGQEHLQFSLSLPIIWMILLANWEKSSRSQFHAVFCSAALISTASGGSISFSSHARGVDSLLHPLPHDFFLFAIPSTQPLGFSPTLPYLCSSLSVHGHTAKLLQTRRACERVVRMMRMWYSTGVRVFNECIACCWSYLAGNKR